MELLDFGQDGEFSSEEGEVGRGEVGDSFLDQGNVRGAPGDVLGCEAVVGPVHCVEDVLDL